MDVVSIHSKSDTSFDEYSQSVEVRTLNSFTHTRTGESRASDAFSLDADYDPNEPNSGQIMLNQVIAMSAYSAENGAQFIFDGKNMGTVARRNSHSTTSESDDDSGDEMTEFSYSKCNAKIKR